MSGRNNNLSEAVNKRRKKHNRIHDRKVKQASGITMNNRLSNTGFIKVVRDYSTPLLGATFAPNLVS